jgi:hypothetical protein
MAECLTRPCAAVWCRIYAAANSKEVTAEIISNIKCFYEATWHKRSLPVAILPDGN